MLFIGDFNAQTQMWYPDGDVNPEGANLDNLFSDSHLTQIISEPTHFMRDTCNPTCINLIVTDQTNLVLNSGVRDLLDATVKHKIVSCKINFKIPPLPKYSRKFWHFDRAREDFIKEVVLRYPWEISLGNQHPNRQADILNVPNDVK